MNRARIAFAATVVTTLLGAAAAQAGQTQSVLAGKKFTPPIKGEALVEYTAPVTKKEGDKVVTRILVRNKSIAPIARLQISETWFDKGGAIIAGGRGVINGLLQPNEVQTIVIETPWKAGMNGNGYNFTHANGTVKPAKVAKLDAPAAATTAGAAKEPAAKPAAAKK